MALCGYFKLWQKNMFCSGETLRLVPGNKGGHSKQILKCLALYYFFPFLKTNSRTIQNYKYSISPKQTIMYASLSALLGVVIIISVTEMYYYVAYLY